MDEKLKKKKRNSFSKRSKNGTLGQSLKYFFREIKVIDNEFDLSLKGDALLIIQHSTFPVGCVVTSIKSLYV